MHGSAMPWITNRISTPSGEPKRATSEILPDAPLLDRLASSAPVVLARACDSTLHGVDFAFLRRTGALERRDRRLASILG